MCCRNGALAKQKAEADDLLRDACEKLREEMTRQLTGDSEQRIVKLQEEFKERLAAEIASERSRLQTEMLVHFYRKFLQ